MRINAGKLSARILFIPVSAFFLYQVIWIFRRGLVDVIFSYSEDGEDVYAGLFPLLEIFSVIFLFWIALHFVLEITAHFKKNRFLSYWLRHLRYAPIATLVLFSIITVFFDLGMIEYSKWQIRNYVFSDSQTIEQPDFRLHNNYRGWCGNGAFAQENYLYFDTASAGIDHKDPYIRARSLLMTSQVRDWVNGGDERFDNFLAKSCRDSDPIVRTAAESYLTDGNSTCSKYLSTK